MNTRVMTVQFTAEAVEGSGMPPGKRLRDKVYVKILTNSRILDGRYRDETGSLELVIQRIAVTAWTS